MRSKRGELVRTTRELVEAGKAAREAERAVEGSIEEAKVLKEKAKAAMEALREAKAALEALEAKAAKTSAHVAPPNAAPVVLTPVVEAVVPASVVAENNQKNWQVTVAERANSDEGKVRRGGVIKK